MFKIAKEHGGVGFFYTGCYCISLPYFITDLFLCLAERQGRVPTYIYLTSARLILQDRSAGSLVTDNVRVVDLNVFVDRDIVAVKCTSFSILVDILLID
jgi:hypothetical protein